MDKNKFNLLCKEDQNKVFEEMCDLYNLVNSYPITYNDLKICAEWIMWMGCHDDELEKRLNGFYPSKWLSEGIDIEEILKCSNEALQFVKYWNNKIKQVYEYNIY